MLATPDQQISPGGQFPHAETRSLWTKRRHIAATLPLNLSIRRVALHPQETPNGRANVGSRRPDPPTRRLAALSA
jgi:hypothetical protein